jgi:putative aldouronate transport system substrate-binding protein
MKLRSALCVFLVCVVFVSPLFAGGRQPASSATGSQTGDRYRTTITILTAYDSAEPPAVNQVSRRISEFTNVDMEFIWAPGGSGYNDRYATTMASGDLPTLILVPDNKHPITMSAIEGGAFWELTPHIPRYANLNDINPDVYYNLSLEGKIWFIPRNRPVVKDGIVYRKDWLRKLGLREPRTLDELYQVARAFTENDPDGNGIKDTYGVADVTLMRFGYLVSAISGINGWIFRDGRMVPSHYDPSYMRVMKFYRDLYTNGYMNKDFPLLQLAGIWEKVNKNEAGIVITDPEQINRFGDLRKIVPTAEFGTFAALDNGKIVQFAGYNSSYAIPTTRSRTEKDLFRVLQFLEDICSDEIHNLFMWGIEGQHYSMNGGIAERTPAQEAQYMTEAFTWERSLRIREEIKSIPGKYSPEVTEYWNLVREMTPRLIPNPVVTFISPTQVADGPRLNNIINDARLKYIMGEINDAAWEAAVNQWRTSGGDKVIQEYTDLHIAQQRRR